MLCYLPDNRMPSQQLRPISNIAVVVMVRWGDTHKKALSQGLFAYLPMGLSLTSWLLRKQCPSPAQEMF